MSSWPSSKATRVLAALYRIGWSLKRQSGSHKVLARPGWPDLVFAFHDREEIGPRMLSHRQAFRFAPGGLVSCSLPPNNALLTDAFSSLRCACGAAQRER
jgi:predicted RNA binding protein YcfA (HicA-like mRNA interferase family)